MNRSLSGSERKLVIMMPGTPKDREGGLFNHSHRKAPALSRSPKAHNSSSPRPHNSKTNTTGSFGKINFMQKFTYNTDKIFREPKKLTQRKDAKRKRKIADTDFFSMTPTNTDQRTTPKTRVLSRRPQHMSFRNIHKSESSWIKPATSTPSTCNYEFSGNMLLNVMTHTHKPVKFRLMSKRDYIPAAWNRNL